MTAIRHSSVVAIVLALSACGGGGGGGGGQPPPQPPPPPPPPSLDTQYLASGPTPFSAGCDGVAAAGTLYVNAEVEPQVAVNPLDSNNLVGAWQQDRWSTGGARGLVAAASFDGGRTWSRRAMPFSRCGGGNAANGGDYARATDPWVSFSPNGTVHQIALSFSGQTFQQGSASAVLASRSIDGGRTWDPARVLISDGPTAFNDKETITADPTDSNLVYATWDRLVSGGGGPAWFARSIDGGASWQMSRIIYDPGINSQTLGNVIVVLPDGTLVDLFTRLDNAAGGGFTASLQVIRSTNKGISWSAPVKIADLLAVGARDPDTGAAIRDGSTLGEIAVAPGGQLYVVWQDARFSNGARDGIAISRSTDGGVTWSMPSRVNGAPTVPAFTPTVHLRADGSVGVMYYDFRSNTTSTATLPTDLWLAISRDGGVSWSDHRVSEAFDLDIAPNAQGLFLGDYQGLSHRGTVFVPFYVKTTGDASNRTEVRAAPAVSVTSAAAVAARAPAIATAAGASQPVSQRFRQRISDNIVRKMEARIPGWRSKTMPVRTPKPGDPDYDPF